MQLLLFRLYWLLWGFSWMDVILCGVINLLGEEAVDLELR
ncbi:MAG: hypothetical protein RLZZ399_2151 [Verrucomicrobiota bacterium]